MGVGDGVGVGDGMGVGVGNAIPHVSTSSATVTAGNHSVIGRPSGSRIRSAMSILSWSGHKSQDGIVPTSIVTPS